MVFKDYAVIHGVCLLTLVFRVESSSKILWTVLFKWDYDTRICKKCEEFVKFPRTQNRYHKKMYYKGLCFDAS